MLLRCVVLVLCTVCVIAVCPLDGVLTKQFLEDNYSGTGYISIRYCSIHTIEDGAFLAPTVNPTRLQLYGNHLKRITNRTFEGLSWLYDLELYSNHIETIDDNAFWNLTSLRELELRSNNIAELRRGTFNGLPNLYRLKLNGNHIETIDDNSFLNLTSLRELELTSNNIAELRKGTFHGLPNLQSLYLSNNYLLTNITDGTFNELTALTRLSLQRTSLPELTGAIFQGLRSLRYLHLLYAKIRIIGANVFEHLNSLIYLDLRYNEIENITDGTFFGLNATGLNIDLRYNPIRYIADYAICACQGIRILYVGSAHPLTVHLTDFMLCHLPTLVLLHLENVTVDSSALRFVSPYQLYMYNVSITTHINDVSVALGEMNTTSLQILTLSNNNIQYIDSFALRNLSKVHLLVINFNNITELNEDTFNGMIRLKELNLNDNKIALIHPGTFDGLEALEKLTVRNNLITTLFHDSFKFESPINILDLFNNSINAVEDGTFRSKFNFTCRYGHNRCYPSAGEPYFRLASVNVANNKLTQITQNMFSGMDNVGTLNLRNNKITSIATNAFHGIPNVTSIDLIYNQLSEIQPGLFSNTPNLTSLSLQYNNIRSITNDVFYGLDKLRAINIEANEIQSLSEENTKWLLINKTVYLNGNPFYCNCELNWFRDLFLNDSSIESRYKYGIRCYSPFSLVWHVSSFRTFGDFKCIEPSQPTILSMTSGRYQVLTCESAGDPAPLITWITPKNDSIVYVSHLTYKTFLINRATLPLLQSRSENGRYICQATNLVSTSCTHINVVNGTVSDTIAGTSKGSNCIFPVKANPDVTKFDISSVATTLSSSTTKRSCREDCVCTSTQLVTTERPLDHAVITNSKEPGLDISTITGNTATTSDIESNSPDISNLNPSQYTTKQMPFTDGVNTVATSEATKPVTSQTSNGEILGTGDLKASLSTNKNTYQTTANSNNFPFTVESFTDKKRVTTAKEPPISPLNEKVIEHSKNKGNEPNTLYLNVIIGLSVGAGVLLIVGVIGFVTVCYRIKNGKESTYARPSVDNPSANVSVYDSINPPVKQQPDGEQSNTNSNDENIYEIAP